MRRRPMPTNPDPLYTTEEAADYLGVKVNTMLAWRMQNVGPHWVKVGKRLVKYRQSDLEKFIERGAVPAERQEAP